MTCLEIFKDIIVPIVAAILGAIAGSKSTYRANRDLKKEELKIDLKTEWNSGFVQVARAFIKKCNSKGNNDCFKEKMLKALISKDIQIVENLVLNNKCNEHAYTIQIFLEKLRSSYEVGLIDKNFIFKLVGSEPIELLTGSYEEFFKKIVYQECSENFKNLLGFYEKIANQTR